MPSARLLFALVLFVLTVAPAAAAKPDPAIARVKAALHELVPNVSPDAVRPSPIPGIYEADYGARTLYVSADGRYLIEGDILDLKRGVNLTAQRQAKGRIAALKALGEKNMIVYPADGKTRYTISIFYDIDCPYCRRLHAETPKLNKLGVRVRYLAFPRAGIGSASYHEAVSVWCAKDRRKALDRANAGESVPQATCPNPVAEEYRLGEQLGVQGTPTIILPNGRLVPGYAPAEQLLQILKQGGGE